MIARIIHLADIHIRDAAREKFAAALRELSARIADVPRDSVPMIAVIVGDLFHSKTRISAENIVDCYALFDCLAIRASSIIIIPGEHDISPSADLLSSIIANGRALANGAKIRYWHRNAWYSIAEIPEIVYYVFATFGPPSKLPAAVQTRAMFRVALAHGEASHDMRECLAGDGGFDVAMCGYQHDYCAMSRAPLIVFPGAFTQLNIGESFDKGFVMWTFARESRNIAHFFVPLNVPGALIKYVSTSSRTTCNRASASGALPRDASRIVIELGNGITKDAPEIAAIIMRANRECPDARIEVIASSESVASATLRAIDAKSSRSVADICAVHRDAIARKIRESTPDANDAMIAAVFALHVEAVTHACAASSIPIVAKWRPLFLSWNNLFCYGPNNYINFESLAGIAGLIAPNRCGKSSVIDILVLAMFNETLRGSAYNIIRRGAKEGSLSCAWVSSGKRHEIARKWDNKGHTTMRYVIDGIAQDKCTDLRKTYAIIAQSVGTIEDFLAAALVPQHAESSSFLDLTDARRRAILARILGLDVLDGALDYVREREREYLAESRALESQTGAALARMRDARATRVAGGALLDGDAKDSRDPVAEKYRELIECARETTAQVRDELEKLERMPAIVKPSRTSRELQADIRAIASEIARLEGDITERERALDERRAQFNALAQAHATVTSMPDIDAMRARIDASMLLLGRARGAEIDNVDANIELASDKLRDLREVLRILRELTELGEVREVLAESAMESSEHMTLAEIKRELVATPVPRADIPENCTCGGIPERAAELRAHMRALECALFAPKVKIPREIPATLRDAIARAGECCAKLSMQSRTASDDDDRAHVMELAYCAIRATRLMGSDAHDINMRELEEELAAARECVAHHDEIMSARAIRARIASLTKNAEYAHAERAHVLRAELAKLGADRWSRVGMRDIDDTIRQVMDEIFKCERAHATLIDLRAALPRIRAAQAQEREVLAAQAALDARIRGARDIVAIERFAADLSAIRAKLDIERAKLATARENMETVAATEEAWHAFCGRQHELEELRSTYARAQTTLINVTAEAKEYESTRVEWRAIGEKQRAIHEHARICALYRGALDARTGIQQTLMLGAVGIIEAEVNRMLEPIAGLRITFDMHGTMRVNVRDVSRDIEHPAELCSGFQRFIINVALRRAFLCAAIRPMPRFIIIDEGFGCIDETNMIKVCEYLPELARELEFMLIVSHTEALSALITIPLNIDTGAGIISALRFGAELEIGTARASSASAPGALRKIGAKAQDTEMPSAIVAEKCADGAYFCKACAKGFKNWSRHKKSAKHIARCDGVFK